MCFHKCSFAVFFTSLVDLSYRRHWSLAYTRLSERLEIPNTSWWKGWAIGAISINISRLGMSFEWTGYVLKCLWKMQSFIVLSLLFWNCAYAFCNRRRSSRRRVFMVHGDLFGQFLYWKRMRIRTNPVTLVVVVHGGWLRSVMMSRLH